MTSRVSLDFRAGPGGEPLAPEWTADCGETGVEVAVETAPWGASLVGGSVLTDTAVSVGVGCSAEVRSDDPGEAVTAQAATDAQLCWFAGPATVCGDRSTRAAVRLAANSRLAWAEQVELDQGDSWTWRSRLRIVREGWPLLCSEYVLGSVLGLWPSAALLAGATAVSAAVIVDPGTGRRDWKAGRRAEGRCRAMALPLSGPGLQVFAYGDDPGVCRELTASLLTVAPRWAADRWERWAHQSPRPEMLASAPVGGRI